MKRNFDEVITDLDNEPVRVGMTPDTIAAALAAFWPKLTPEQGKALNEEITKAAGKPLTLGGACVGALMGAYQGEENLDDMMRLTRMELARKIHKGGVLEIEPKDRDLIKPLLKKKWAGILVPVTAAELLEKEPVADLHSVA
jgi:hypothetical protein